MICPLNLHPLFELEWKIQFRLRLFLVNALMNTIHKLWLIYPMECATSFNVKFYVFVILKLIFHQYEYLWLLFCFFSLHSRQFLWIQMCRQNTLGWLWTGVRNNCIRSLSDLVLTWPHWLWSLYSSLEIYRVNVLITQRL